MGITSALVLFFVIWFLVFLVVIPIRLETQGVVGEVEPGTHAGVGLGMKPPMFLKSGDTMKLSIQGLGEQNQKCIQA